jgi:NAD(P)-dependent dehydrogenase (short-subunit alcohol dehydrogenase family)
MQGRVDHRFEGVQGLLEDKLTIITGAASGMGRAAAVKFAENSAKVLIANVSDAEGELSRSSERLSGRAFFSTPTWRARK